MLAVACAAASLRDHLLTSYQVALSSVLGVQFSAKRFEKGREGVLRLAQQRGGPALPWRGVAALWSLQCRSAVQV